MTVTGSCLYVVLVCLMPVVIYARGNLDISEPIVKWSPAAEEDSFGFAVTLHQVEVPLSRDIDSFLDRTRIIVGAPRGTYPGGLDLPESPGRVNNTGLVYQCSLRAGSCTGLTSNVSDPNSTNRRLFDGDPDFQDGPLSERKNNQQMGSVLTSRAGLFVACAPLWVVIHRELSTDLDPRRPVGRCFVSSRNLQEFNELRPCEGRMASISSQTFRGDNQCLSGFSSSILDSEPEPTVVLGLVGDNFFNGNINYYTVNSSTGRNSSGPFTTRSNFIPHPSDQYDGFSTTTGFVTNIDVEDSISAAPRYNGEFLTGLVRVRSQSNGLTEDTVIPGIGGLQTGEYFGYCVATADLNGDRFDEVIVGAPMFSTTTSQEVGRVYIFENVNGNLSNTSAPILLTGGGIPLARFGTSIVNLGDINDDGYEDIAVGAPYEGNELHNNTGTVYIYYGTSSGNGLISRSPDQILLSEDIVNTIPDLTSLQTFGFSLSSSDVDGNEFNDLLVGAYESKTAVLIRSLSVASVTVSISSENNIRLDRTNFTITVCASYTGRALDGRQLSELQIFSAGDLTS